MPINVLIRARVKSFNNIDNLSLLYCSVQVTVDIYISGQSI